MQQLSQEEEGMFVGFILLHLLRHALRNLPLIIFMMFYVNMFSLAYRSCLIGRVGEEEERKWKLEKVVGGMKGRYIYN